MGSSAADSQFATAIGHSWDFNLQHLVPACRQPHKTFLVRMNYIGERERGKKKENSKQKKKEKQFSKFWWHSSVEAVTGATLLCSPVAWLRKEGVIIGFSRPRQHRQHKFSDSFTHSQHWFHMKMTSPSTAQIFVFSPASSCAVCFPSPGSRRESRTALISI